MINKLNITDDKKCAPSKIYDDNSCFTLESIQKICIAYNKAIREKQIPHNKFIDVTDDKRKMIIDLTDRLSYVCDNQICWLKQQFIKKIKNHDINNNTFRPKGPQGKFEWLNTTNINRVIEQYQDIHSDFKFLGTVPMDFDDLPMLKIKNIDFDDLINNGIKKIGMVVNLDEHWKSGSHWVSLFANLDKSLIYYFDSYGKRPEKRIRSFIKRIAKWCYKRHHLNCNIDDMNCSPSDASASFMLQNGSKNKIESKLDVEYNRNRHQFKNSECGVYSINFILRLLEDESFVDITDNRTLDDEMNNNRNIYFRFI